MKKVLVHIGFSGMGDIICATPVIRKLYNVYERKISVASRMPMIFDNSPFVEESIFIDNCNVPSINHHTTDEFLSKYEDDYIIHRIGVGETNGESDGEFFRHIRHMTLTNYMASQLGFHLWGKDHELNFFPEKVDIRNKLNIPREYICLNISRNSKDREWDIKNFQMLVNLLNEDSIYVVLVGKSIDKEFHKFTNPHLYRDGDHGIELDDININITNGINLFDQTTLYEVWDIINNSKCFITMDSGLLHLAGTTDTHIIQIGSTVNPIFRAPVRNNSQAYKYSFIGGECREFCASNLKYSVRNFGNVKSMLVDGVCYEYYDTYKCHPNINQVYDKCMEVCN